MLCEQLRAPAKGQGSAHLAAQVSSASQSPLKVQTFSLCPPSEGGHTCLVFEVMFHFREPSLEDDLTF